MAKLSKISSLSRHVREELNTRLDNGQRGPEILSWLNSLPEVLEVLRRHYDGIAISDQNLSAWRETGFCEWQDGMERLQRLQRLCEISKRLGGTAGGLLGGTAAIAAGHVQELLESLDIDHQKELLQESPASFIELIDKLSRLQKSQAEAERTQDAKARTRLAQEKGERDNVRLALDREKFEVATAQAILKAAKSPEVQQILKGGGSNAEKIKALRAAMFPTKLTDKT